MPRSSPLFLSIAIFVHWQIAGKGLLNRVKLKPHRSSNYDFLISLRFCYAPNGHIVFERIRSGCQVCRRSAKRMVQNSLGPCHWTQLSFTRPWAISTMDLLGPFKTKAYKGARPTRNNAQVLDSHVLVIVCKLSKLISAQVMDGKDIESLSSAFTRHCSLHGVPTFLGIDADPAQTLMLS